MVILNILNILNPCIANHTESLLCIERDSQMYCLKVTYWFLILQSCGLVTGKQLQK